MILTFKNYLIKENITNDFIYHGTNKDIDILDVNKIEYTHQYYGDAIYFTSNYDVAKYYGRNIFILNKNIINFDIILDANENGINEVGLDIKNAIKNKKNIIVENVFDSNILGTQCKSFNINDMDVYDYKYISNYYLKQKIKRLTPKIKNMINLAKNKKIDIKIEYNNIFKEKYITTLHSINSLSKKDAFILNDIGFDVLKSMCLTPKIQTTYIIIDNDILKYAKKIDV